MQGSAEALKAALTKLSTEKVKVIVIAAGVGGITESDVNLAKAGGAIIVGFHVRPAGKSSKLAEQEGVEIRLYDIIYDALDDVKAAMAGLLAPIKREVAMGKLQVRETFSIPKMGTVAGCMVTDGKINRKAHLRIIRDAVQVYEGKVGSLRRFKDDVSEVQHGFECGVMVAGWNEIKTGRRHRGLRGHRRSRAALSVRPTVRGRVRSCTSVWPSSASSSARAIRSRKSGWCCGGSRIACASGSA